MASDSGSTLADPSQARLVCPEGCNKSLSQRLTPREATPTRDVATRAITTHHPPSTTQQAKHSTNMKQQQGASQTGNTTSTTHRAAGGQSKTGVSKLESAQQQQPAAAAAAAAAASSSSSSSSSISSFIDDRSWKPLNCQKPKCTAEDPCVGETRAAPTVPRDSSSQAHYTHLAPSPTAQPAPHGTRAPSAPPRPLRPSSRRAACAAEDGGHLREVSPSPPDRQPVAGRACRRRRG